MDPDVIVVTRVVPVGKERLAGAVPSTIPVVLGLVLSTRRKMMYPVFDAPDPGKVAAVHAKSICEDPFAVAVNEVAAAVGSLDKV